MGHTDKGIVKSFTHSVTISVIWLVLARHRNPLLDFHVIQGREMMTPLKMQIKQISHIPDLTKNDFLQQCLALSFTD